MTLQKASFIISGLLISVGPSSSRYSEDEKWCANFGNICYPYDQKPCCGEHQKCSLSKFTNNRYECLCDVDYEWIDNKCIRVPDKVCAGDFDCQTQRNSKCSEEHKCECRENYVKTDYSTCRPLIRAFCEKNEDCFPDNTICIQNRCHCADNFISQSNDRCLPTFFKLNCKSPEDGCREQDFWPCERDRCFCPKNHVMMDNKTCLPLLNEACSKEKSCIVDNSECIESKCQCKPNYRSNSYNRCLPTRLYDKCKNFDDCSDIKNSKCSKFNDCVCKSNFFYWNETICAPTIGTYCSKSTDCLIGNSTCIEHECKCKPYFKSHFNERCVPVLNEPCNGDYDCVSVSFAECSANKTCVCQKNYVESEDGCSPPVIGICQADSDCVTQNSYCHYNKCRCKNNYFPQVTDGVYVCKQIKLGLFCKNNNDCSVVKNSQCSDSKICVCKDSFYANDDGNLCLPSIGEFCSSDRECLFENSFCFENTCQCKPNYASVSYNQCVLKSSTVSCEKTFECGGHWHFGCSFNKTCFCKPNHTLINRSTCLPLLGGNCWKDDQCVVKNSVCTDFHCQCDQPLFKAVAVNMCT